MTQLLDLNEQFTQLMRERYGAMTDQMVLPPPIFAELGSEVVALDVEAGMMQMRFPFEQRFTNPLGYMQGGMIGAAMDNTIGPLSFLVAPPSVTVRFDMRFLKPINAPITHFWVTAQLESHEGRKLTFTATAHDEERSIEYTTAHAEHLILRK
jgi:acyl-coenzyme A thioesterase PaaI-like protein